MAFRTARPKPPAYSPEVVRAFVTLADRSMQLKHETLSEQLDDWIQTSSMYGISAQRSSGIARRSRTEEQGYQFTDWRGTFARIARLDPDFNERHMARSYVVAAVSRVAGTAYDLRCATTGQLPDEERRSMHYDAPREALLTYVGDDNRAFAPQLKTFGPPEAVGVWGLDQVVSHLREPLHSRGSSANTKRLVDSAVVLAVAKNIEQVHSRSLRIVADHLPLAAPEAPGAVEAALGLLEEALAGVDLFTEELKSVALPAAGDAMLLQASQQHRGAQPGGDSQRPSNLRDELAADLYGFVSVADMAGTRIRDQIALGRKLTDFAGAALALRAGIDAPRAKGPTAGLGF